MNAEVSCLFPTSFEVRLIDEHLQKTNMYMPMEELYMLEMNLSPEASATETWVSCLFPTSFEVRLIDEHLQKTNMYMPMEELYMLEMNLSPEASATETW